MHRIQDCRGGKMNDTTFGKRMRGEGLYAEQIASLFDAAERKHGLDNAFAPINDKAFRRPEVAGTQLKLF